MNSIDWKNASPASINAFRAMAAVIAYSTITPLYYQGVIAGSEFLTYNAGKCYFALDVTFGPASFGATIATNGEIAMYNMANTVCLVLNNKILFYNTTAAAVNAVYNSLNETNVYFSRIFDVGTIFQYIKFNGYRLNI